MTSGNWMQSPNVSVVIATYNRASQLRETLQSVLDQAPDTPSFEVIVVDNNSIDETASVVRALQATVGARLRYVKEPQQWNAYARNTGIRQAKASIIAFTDDDVLVAKDWVQRIVETFRNSPSSAFVGGPVLPLWDGRPPEWLTVESWAPVAAVDYGAAPFQVAGSDPRYLLTANLAIRREAIERVGMFLPVVQREKDSIGSLEDHELLTRLCDAGESGMYVPSMTAYTTIDTERLSKRYHRRWHRGHGRFHAMLRNRRGERSRATVLGVPSHVYRQVLSAAGGWLGATLRRAPAKAFHQETQFWFALGFIRERISRKRSEGQ
jgi:glycosyltransferase involved in cell wall biosynthesis